MTTENDNQKNAWKTGYQPFSTLFDTTSKIFVTQSDFRSYLSSPHFGKSQLVIAIGVMLFVIGLVALRVLADREEALRRTAVRRTWEEVIIPNRLQLAEISQRYILVNLMVSILVG